MFFRWLKDLIGIDGMETIIFHQTPLIFIQAAHLIKVYESLELDATETLFEVMGNNSNQPRV
jgi:hypothetical protein